MAMTGGKEFVQFYDDGVLTGEKEEQRGGK